MKIGYARVSTFEQNLDLQLDELKKAGCKRFYQEKITGAGKVRPQLEQLIKDLRKDDIVVIWKLDRLGRSLQDLVNLVNIFQEKKVGLQSLQDAIDTSTTQGKFTFHIFASLAEFEREIIRDRTNAGLRAARARGRLGGRPTGLNPQAENTAKLAEHLYNEGQLTIRQICQQLGICQRTLYKYLRHQNVEIGKVANKK